MAEQDAIRDLIKKGEERLSHSKSTLARLKSAETQTARILSKVRDTSRPKGLQPM
jgi:hypothetical protein